MFQCLLCDKICKSLRGVKKHLAAHSSTKPKSPDTSSLYPCSMCPYVGQTHTLLNLHKETKHNPDRKIYKCEKCDFTCLQERSLLMHKQRHKGEGSFACDQCGKLFVSMSILKRHVKTHNKTKPFVCPVPNCGQSFAIRGRLGDHLRTVKHTRKTVTKSQNNEKLHLKSSEITG